MRISQLVSSDDNDPFGPGTDLIISLAAVLIILMAISINLYHKQLQELIYDINTAQKNQMDLIKRIADTYNTSYQNPEPDTYIIENPKNKQEKIIIQNSVRSQSISFSSSILFKTDDISITENGKKVLTQVAEALKAKLDTFEEIQIQGHADILKSSKYSSNLKLASGRALTVFEELTKLGIDPVEHLMSATTYGEYHPVGRSILDKDYNHSKIREDNNTLAKRMLNRRIELVIIFRCENKLLKN